MAKEEGIKKNFIDLIAYAANLNQNANLNVLKCIWNSVVRHQNKLGYFSTGLCAIWHKIKPDLSLLDSIFLQYSLSWQGKKEREDKKEMDALLNPILKKN